MDVILLALVVLACLLIIASGFWVGVALIRALSLPPRIKSTTKTSQEGGPGKP